MSSKTSSNNSVFQWIFLVAALVIILGAMKQVSAFAIPLLYGFFLALIGNVPMRYLISRGFPRVLSVLIVVLVVIGSMATFSVLLGRSVNEFSALMPEYQARIKNVYLQFGGWLGQGKFDLYVQQAISEFNPSSAVELLSYSLLGIVGAMSQIFIVVLYAIFILLEASVWGEKTRRAFGGKKSLLAFQEFATEVENYAIIKTLLNLLATVLVGLIGYMLGVKFFLLWALLTFLLCYVPVIGPLIAIVPPVIFTFVDLGVSVGILMIVLLAIVHFVVGNILEPMLMGKHLDLSPLVVFVALSFWGWLWGISGMLLAVPLTIMIKIALRSSPDFRSLAVLLGGK